MKRARLGLIVVAVLILIAGILNEVSKATCFSFTGRLICRVETDQRLVALTFDDGPTALGVDSVLPVLDRYNAKATFFLVGASPEIALTRKIVAAGHEVGNHSFTHKRMA